MARQWRRVLPLAFATTFMMSAAVGAAASSNLTTPFSWGLGLYGALGDGTTSDALAPVAVTTSGVLAGKSVVQISGGGLHACALTEDGIVACWGSNANGQLGDGTTNSSSVPISIDTSGVLSGKRIIEIQASNAATCALSSDGQVACWGWNIYGQLGDGSNTTSNVPVSVVRSGASALNGRTVTSLSPGGFGTVCAVLDNGTGACWGAGVRGTLGNGGTSNSSTPVAITMSGPLASSSIESIAVGALHACAVTAAGQLACWGLNGDGQVGIGTSGGDVLTPVAVDTTGVFSGQLIRQVSPWFNSTCAITQSGIAACWGANNSGVVGIGSAGADVLSPTAVSTASAINGKFLTQIAMGTSHACALASDASVACWGLNTGGVLGTGTSSSSLVPIAVDQDQVLRNYVVSQLSSGDYNSYVLAAPSIDQADQRPPDKMQQVQRGSDESCGQVADGDLSWGTGIRGGWGASWAEWPNNGTGGFVCNRIFTYAQNYQWRVQ